MQKRTYNGRNCVYYSLIYTLKQDVQFLGCSVTLNGNVGPRSAYAVHGGFLASFLEMHNIDTAAYRSQWRQVAQLGTLNIATTTLAIDRVTMV